MKSNYYDDTTAKVGQGGIDVQSLRRHDSEGVRLGGIMINYLE